MKQRNEQKSQSNAEWRVVLLRSWLLGEVEGGGLGEKGRERREQDKRGGRRAGGKEVEGRKGGRGRQNVGRVKVISGPGAQSFE